MTTAERRIEIVKDAIAQLLAKVYKADGEKTYVKLPTVLRELIHANPDLDAQYSLQNCTETCEVCAKGSLLLSTIRKEDRFTFGKFAGEHNSLMERLTDDNLFDQHNLNLLEVYFENWRVRTYDALSSGWVLYSHSGWFMNAYVGFGCSKDEARKLASDHNIKISEWCNKHQDRNERLLAILENMRDNEGVFKPL